MRLLKILAIMCTLAFPEISSAIFLYDHQELCGGTIDNSNTAFTITLAPYTAKSVALYLDGLLLVQGTDYTISGKNITMTTAPNFFQTLYAMYSE